MTLRRQRGESESMARTYTLDIAFREETRTGSQDGPYLLPLILLRYNRSKGILCFQNNLTRSSWVLLLVILPAKDVHLEWWRVAQVQWVATTCEVGKEVSKDGDRRIYVNAHDGQG